MKIHIKTLTGKCITLEVMPDMCVGVSTPTPEQLAPFRSKAAVMLQSVRDELHGNNVTIWISANLSVEMPVPATGKPAGELLADVARLCERSKVGVQVASMRLMVRSSRRILAPAEDVRAALPAGDALVLVPSFAEISADGAPLDAPYSSANGSEGYSIFVVLGGSKLVQLTVTAKFTIKQLRGLIKRKHAELVAKGTQGTNFPAKLPDTPGLLFKGQTLRDDVVEGITSRATTLKDCGVIRGSVLAVTGLPSGCSKDTVVPVRLHVPYFMDRECEDKLLSEHKLPLSMPIASLRALAADAVKLPVERVQLYLGDGLVELVDGTTYGDYGAVAQGAYVTVRDRKHEYEVEDEEPGEIDGSDEDDLDEAAGKQAAGQPASPYVGPVRVAIKEQGSWFRLEIGASQQ